MERLTRIPEPVRSESIRPELIRAMPEIPPISTRNVDAGILNIESSNVRIASEREAIESGDTLAFRSPVLRLDQDQRERERILPPNAAGPLGSSYKMLRTQVLRRMDQLHANTLAVVSPTPGAGKTLTAINLAIAIAAEAGRTVLLVDLDLRNPCIGKRFGIKREIGIEDCLQTRRPIQEAMVKIDGYERLTVLPARERIEHSSELLTDRYCAEVMAEMRTRYANRIVIFDLPPVLQADDALAISRSLQAGLVVVGEGKTKRDEVTRSIELLHELTIIGTVLNASRDSDRMHY
jgi:protein-tyrosine kinase